MINAEHLHAAPVEGEVLSDPGTLIRNFKGIRRGQHSQEAYFEWVKAQAKKVKEEQEKREVNPDFATTDEDFAYDPEEVVLIKSDEQEEGIALQVRQRSEMPGGGYTFDSVTFYFVDGGFSHMIASATQKSYNEEGNMSLQEQHYLGFGEGKAVYNFNSTHSDHGEVSLP